LVGWGAGEGDLRPFPQVEVAVRQGVLWVRSPYLCEGYDGPGGSLQRDGDGFATVGDRGALRDGRLLVHGRGDETVLTGGTVVHCADVEATLRPVAHGELVVVGVPHPRLGQVVTAVLTDPGDLPATRMVGRSTLDRAAQPRLWFTLERLPLTAAGKVDRAALTRWLSAGGRGVRRLP
jgi:acyl-CoA synthetase (AMP-forming)/AMP-acid ligase II